MKKLLFVTGVLGALVIAVSSAIFSNSSVTELTDPMNQSTLVVLNSKDAPLDDQDFSAIMNFWEVGQIRPIKNLFSKQKISAQRDPDRESRYDQPGEADEFYRLKRIPEGERDIPVDRYLTAHEHMKSMPLYSTAQKKILTSSDEKLSPDATWTSLGPGNIGGRTRALIINPINPNIMYAGAAAGGVWKSTNAGASWTPLNDLMANLAVSCLAFDPNNPNIIYAGTGEGFANIDAVRGLGIFKTTDGGTTWSQITATNNSNFYRVNDIVVSPTNVNRIYVATGEGVFRSVDSGQTWIEVLSPPVIACLDLVIRTDVATDYVFASCGGRIPLDPITVNTRAIVYQNTDAGGSGTWTNVLEPPLSGRTSLAISPSNQAVVYALVSEYVGVSGVSNPYEYALSAVFRSESGGGAGSWVARVQNTDPNKLNTILLSYPYSAFLDVCQPPPNNTPDYRGQAWYDNVIAVDPLDPNRVWVGGIDLFRSDDGGQNWGLASYWEPEARTTPNYVHADQHQIVFHPQFNGTSNKTMFVSNDGGMFRTNDARGPVVTGPNAPCSVGATPGWTSLNNGYGSTQFYHGLSYPNGTTYFGGTQDNGTIRGSDSGGPNGWYELLAGDGGFVAVDPTNVNVTYAERPSPFIALAQNEPLYGFQLFKSTDGGNTYSNAFPQGTGYPWVIFLPPYIMDVNNSQRLFAGLGKFVVRSSNGGSSWSDASAYLQTGVGNDGVSAIAIAPTNSNFALAGTALTSSIFRTNNALTSNSNTSWPGTFLAQGANYVSSLTFDPANENVAYATVSTFGSTHVWRSSNAGATWVGIDGSGATRIPDIPVHCIVVDPNNTSRLYVGTDLGVFVSLNSGATWAIENTGFANVVTESLSLNSSDGNTSLFAFTHGRGAWRLPLTTGGGVTIQFGSAAFSVIENGGTATITVTRSDGSGAASVNFATSNGTATAGSDYTTASGTLNFANGEVSKTFAVPITEDSVFEGDETVNLTLSSPTGATLGTPSAAILTITDNDPQPSLQFSSATGSIGEAGPTITLTVLRTGATGNVVPVQFATANGTATSGGGCTAGVDFLATAGTLSFALGDTSKTFNVPICDDSVVEGNENFTVTLSNAGGGAAIGAPSTQTITITDNDAAPSLQFSAATYSVGEGGGIATITATRTGATGSAVGVNFATVAGGSSSAGASCTTGVDFVNTSGTLNFAAGDTSKTFNVTVCDDASFEGNETVNLALSVPTGGATLGIPNTAVLTINDDEIQPSIQFTSATGSVGEAGPAVTLTAIRTGATGNAVSVQFATANGTATSGGGCTAGVDFLATAGTLNFASGDTSKTFDVPICDDSVVEGNEAFSATLSNPGGGAAIGTPSTQTVTITDNDAAPSLQFSSATFSLGEGGASATITVTRTGATGNAVGVSFASVAGGTATGGAGCTVGVDFINASGNLNFAAGDTTKTFGVTVCEDASVEGNETVNLALSNPTGGATLGSPSTAVLTIVDNDVPSISINDVSLNEGNSGTTNFAFNVSLSAQSGQTVTVNFATADGTAASASDYAANSGTVTFNPSETTKPITVLVNGDTAFEANETLFVNLSIPVNATIADGQGIGTIINDDSAACSYSISPTSQSFSKNGGNGSVQVTTQPGCGWTAVSNSLFLLKDDLNSAFIKPNYLDAGLSSALLPEASFTNPAPIAINDAAIANPYPSTINVSGLSGVIANTPGSVKVTLNGFNHTKPDDIGIVLVAPSGAALNIQDGPGDTTDAVNLTYTISDTGGTQLPADGIWTAGTYKPANYYSDNFPAPGPGTAYGNPGPLAGGTATFASTFSGSNPNGDWKLFVIDAVSGDVGNINGGWTLEVTTAAGAPNTFPGTGVGAIPDGLSGTPPAYGPALVVNFAVSGITAPVTNVSLDVTLTHTWVGDVDMILTAPGGSPSIPVVSRIGVTVDGDFGDSSNYGGTYAFSDAAAGTNIWTVATNGSCATDCIVTPGTYRTTAPGQTGQVIPAPVTNLTATFTGLTTAQANGTWTLRVRDAGAVDTGTVTAANLTIVGTAGGGNWINITSGASGTGSGPVNYTVAANTTGSPRSGTMTIAGQTFTVNQSNTLGRKQSDFDGDGKSDIVVFRESEGNWYFLNSLGNTFGGVHFGIVGDRIVPGDYDGDGKTDFAVWRPSSGTWFILNSTGGFIGVPFGLSTDLPAQGDYDNDGKTDIAVWRPSNGTWFLQQSTAGFAAVQFGANGDRPVPGDYDGDGKTDQAVFRPSEGNWYLLQSTAGFGGIHFGIPTDKVVPADFDGDGKTDVAVFRVDGTGQGVWFLLQSTAGFAVIPFGTTNDIPAPGDFDGDSKADTTVFRPSNGIWFSQQTTSGFVATQFGQNSDKPVPAGYVPVQ